MLCRKAASVVQQFSKNSISFSRFNNINRARHNKLQPFGQPVILTRWCQTTKFRNASYPFDWKRKEHQLPKLPTPEEMPEEVEALVLESADKPTVRENLGKITNFTPSDVQRIFPEGLSGKIVKDLDGATSGHIGLLIRESSLQTISFLENSLQNGFTQPYLFLDGREGTGKSMVMNQAVHWARSQGWIVLFVNNGFEFMRGNFIEKSTLFPDMYDQPELGESLLQGFLSAHGEQLKTLKLRTDFEIEGFTRNENSTLYDLVKFGIDYEEAISSCTAVYHLRRELNLVTEFPVLIAVDGVNSFYDKSSTIYDPLGEDESTDIYRSPLISADKLTLANTFRNFKSNNLLNGTQLYSLSHYPYRGDKFMASNNAPSKENVMAIPKYTKEEWSLIVNYYSKVGLITSDLPAKTRDYAYYLHEGLGGPLMPYIRTVN